MERITLRNLPRGAGLAGALVVLIVAASFISPHFLNPINILNVLRQVAMYGILGIGMTFVILTKGIDLSVGSTVALTGVLGALMMEQGVPIPLMIVACLAIGAVIGAINGLGVSYWRIPAFIMTLGV
jgi:ribose transport system permease protein